jgi:hypothetical protein
MRYVSNKPKLATKKPNRSLNPKRLLSALFCLSLIVPDSQSGILSRSHIIRIISHIVQYMHSLAAHVSSTIFATTTLDCVRVVCLPSLQLYIYKYNTYNYIICIHYSNRKLAFVCSLKARTLPETASSNFSLRIKTIKFCSD